MPGRPISSVNTTDGIVESIVRKWEAETLFAVRDRLSDLAHNQGFEDLRALIEDATDEAQTRLMRGPILSQAEYARALGFLDGLRMLSEIPLGVKRVATQREEQIERRAAEDSEAQERKG
jgi:hypothetical protein